MRQRRNSSHVTGMQRVPARGLISDAYVAARVGEVGSGAAAASVKPKDALTYDAAPSPAACAVADPYGAAPASATTAAGDDGQAIGDEDAQMKGRPLVRRIGRHQPSSGGKDRVGLRPVGEELQPESWCAMVVDLNRSRFTRPQWTRQLDAQSPIALREPLRAVRSAHRVHGKAAPIQLDAVRIARRADDA